MKTRVGADRGRVGGV